MRKIICVIMVVMSMCCLSGCSELEYKAIADFSYSGDKGHTYGDGTKEYAIGETVYMKVNFQVSSNEKKTSQVKAVLTIPKVENVDAKYMDGQVITPNYDPVNNVTTYEFTANASKEPIAQECVIQFVPNAAGDITMTFVFDDNVDSSYDKRSTLEFVEAKKDEVEKTVEEESEKDSED